MVNEQTLDLARKVILSLIVINFTIAIFYAFTGTSLSVSNPKNTALKVLNGLESSLNSYSNEIVNAFNVQIFAPATSINIVNALPTVFVWIINFIDKVLTFIGSVLAVAGISFLIIITLVVGVIPQLFINGGFGVFNYIAVTIYGFLAIFLGIYGLYYINQIYRAWFK